MQALLKRNSLALAILLTAALTIGGATLWMVQPLVLPLAHVPAPSIDPSRLRAHVIALSTTLAPRSHDPDELARSADHIFRQFAEVGAPQRQSFLVWGIGYENISLTLGPPGGARVVIGAHYDSADGLPGADDNASGVAGLLELARLFADVPLAQPVEFVAYALEEPPYFGSEEMGSAAHARALREAGEPVSLMVSLEMIGYFSDAPDSQTYPLPLLEWLYPDRGNFIAVVGRWSDVATVRRAKRAMTESSPLPIWSINAPGFIPGIDLSDHRNFWSEGYPALMITDTAMFRNHAYHTTDDVWERLDYERMAEVVQGVHGIILEFAGKQSNPGEDHERVRGP